ncbi:hypothetical protein SAMN05444173_3363 [Opitutus sp. GAS368]|nr:hypothetical protein SAMN05444173_3363 [Opitutus sp. GAS368]
MNSMTKPACCSPRVISSRSQAGRDGTALELQRLLVEQAEAHNKAAPGTHIPATFMRVTVRL